MIVSLHIENIAVIKSVDIDFKEGFTVFTGETGAGKSIIIDSINLLLGTKTQRELIRTGENTAVVSGLFSQLTPKTIELLSEIGVYPDDDGYVMLQRTLSSDSRSTFRINGRAVSSSVAKEAGTLLINIHGQHDAQTLLNPANHIEMLDEFAKDRELLDEYRKVYAELCQVKKLLEKYKTAQREGVKKAELLEYQINDINSASLKENEDTELLSEKKVLQNSKQLTKQISIVYRAIYKNQKGASASQLIGIARKSCEDIGEIYPETIAYVEKLYDIEAEIQSIAENVITLMPHSEIDSESRINEIDDRLDIIKRLMRKYGTSIAEVLAFANKAQIELDDIKSCSDKITEYTNTVNKLVKKATELATELNKRRSEASEVLAKGICETLSYLDMERVSFSSKVRIQRKTVLDESIKEEYEFDRNGFDKVEFYIATNIGEPEKPLSSIASGGELSRIILAIKCTLANEEAIPTIIFDEVDAGVSGKTSHKIGIKLHELAKTSQILCVTHSAQICSLADTHFLIKKYESDGRAMSKILTLDSDGRVGEIARIVGGVNITEKIMETAREMLSEAAKLQ